MFSKAKARADAYTFSLGGMKTIASFAAVPVIADDRINKVWDERLKRDRDEPGARAWPGANRPAVEGSCA